MKSAKGVPDFGTHSYLPVKTVTICVQVHTPEKLAFSGLGLPFARPDCTEIGYGLVWAKRIFIRTESLHYSTTLQLLT